jgi:AAA+ ATPase superfamily predicted ATPase
LKSGLPAGIKQWFETTRKTNHTWHALVAEPFTWVFLCFFQPARFSQEVDRPGIFRRFLAMVRLILPVFVLAYLLAHLVRWVLSTVVLVYPLLNTLSNDIGSCSQPTPLWVSAGATLLGIAPGLAWGILAGRAGGLARGAALGIACGCTLGSIACVNGNAPLTLLQWEHPRPNVTVIVAATLGGMLGSLCGRLVEQRKAGERWASLKGLVGGLAGALGGLGGSYLVMKLGQSLDISLAVLGGIGGGIVGAIVGGIGEIRRARFVRRIAERPPEVLLWVIFGGIAGGVAGAIGRAIQVIVADKPIAGFILALTAGLVLGMTRGLSHGCAWGLLGGLVWSLILALGLVVLALQGARVLSSAQMRFFTDVQPLAVLGLAFFVGYLPGYFRLPLYPISALSMLWAAFASQRNPPGVFQFLHRSALHWDEAIYLPLPGLKYALLLATEQESQLAQEEIEFIEQEHPALCPAARAAFLEMLLRDLEAAQRLPEMAQAAERLRAFLTHRKLVYRRWETPFLRLAEASQEAALALLPQGWQARQRALQHMLARLNQVYPERAFADHRVSHRVGTVVDTWRAAALQELEAIEHKYHGALGRIANPYKAGNPLDLEDSHLFVGREDLIEKLQEELDRGSARPTFLLTGERRMGKSSTLKQLPRLLSANYLPIYYDLQMPGYTTSTVALLNAIIRDISESLDALGQVVEPLDLLRISSGRVYPSLMNWLVPVEQFLEQEQRTVLLIFDEFESLERTEEYQLKLLMDWFRIIIQHHPRLALLFSGRGTAGEFMTRWAGPLVNVQTLRVSFLRREEARRLITQPTPDFPGERVFVEEVVEMILDLTACQPFLVQGVCETLIGHLNVEKRTQATLSDVDSAVSQFVENWKETYFTALWNHSSQEERTCLSILTTEEQADHNTIALKSGLEESAVHAAMQVLRKRDFVMQKQEGYQIAVPLFRLWIREMTWH